MPLIDVVMGVYNGGDLLARSMHSILAQEMADFRLLVMDDGSTDKTAEVLNRFAEIDSRVTILRQENSGLAVALNTLIRRGDSKYIARMDADDISLPWRLYRQANYLEARPEVAMAGGWSALKRIGNSDVGCQCYPDDDQWLRKQLEAGRNIFVHSSTMMRRDALEAFEEPYRFRLIQDYDLWLRLSESHRIGMLPEVCHVSYLHDERISGRRYSQRRRLHNAILELHRARRSGRAEAESPAEIADRILSRSSDGEEAKIDPDWYAAMTAINLRDYAAARKRFASVAKSRSRMRGKALKWCLALSLPFNERWLPRLYEPLAHMSALEKVAPPSEYVAIMQLLADYEEGRFDPQGRGRAES